MIMKTEKEINGNKLLLNLPPHLIVKLAVWVVLAVWGLFVWGGSFWMWFFELWLAKCVTGVVLRFILGCVIMLISAAFMLWLFVWLLNYLIH